MKKFVVLALGVVIALAATEVRAQEKITMKGIGLSGYVDAAVGLSRVSGDWVPGATFLPGTFPGTIPLSQGSGPNETDFSFAATEFKLHFNKDFGDKATAVASFSVASSGDSSGSSGTSSSGGDFNYDLQQAFVKLNFGESHFLMGRFYAPIGIETVDANQRATVTLGNVFSILEPFFLTGAMLHYAPKEGVGGFIYVANSLNGENSECGTLPACNQPSDLGKALAAGVTYAGDGTSATLQYNVDWAGQTTPKNKVFADATQIVDLSVLHDSDEFLGGFDAIYRRDNFGSANADTFGFELLAAAKMDELTLGGRAEIIHQAELEACIISLTPFLTYKIVDGVFARAEYRHDMIGSFDAEVWTRANQVVAQLNASFE